MKKCWFYVRYGSRLEYTELLFGYDEDVIRKLIFHVYGKDVVKASMACVVQLGSDGLKWERKDLEEEAKLRGQS